MLLGSVYLGTHTIAGKEVAIKVESASAKRSMLKQESRIYKTLMGGPGVPWMMWAGKQGDYNVMIIDLLGPSLDDLFQICNNHFTLKTVLLLADQMVSIATCLCSFHFAVLLPTLIILHDPVMGSPPACLFSPYALDSYLALSNIISKFELHFTIIPTFISSSRISAEYQFKPFLAFSHRVRPLARLGTPGYQACQLPHGPRRLFDLAAVVLRPGECD